MIVAVLVKQVPDTYSERRLRAVDGVLDRDAVDAVIDEIDTRGVEVALQLVEAQGGEVTVVTMGPERSTDALRKALAMGAHRAGHVVDDGLAGSDAMGTSAALAAALRTLSPDLILAGNEASDGKGGAVPAMIAERLGLPQVTSVRKLDVADGGLTAERQLEGGFAEVSASLPAVVSVTEKITEPRYPNFKGIMAAKSKPVTVLGLAELGLDAGGAGLAGAAAVVVDAAPRPAKSGGEKVADDGSGGTKIAEYLVAARLV